MRTLVDGYNVLYTLNFDRGSLEDDRESLIALLQKKRGDIVVVFDGPDFTRTHRGNLEIVYARTADDYLIEEAERLRGRCVIVTADRRLAVEVEHFGARVRGPQDYF